MIDAYEFILLNTAAHDRTTDRWADTPEDETQDEETGS